MSKDTAIHDEFFLMVITGLLVTVLAGLMALTSVARAAAYYVGPTKCGNDANDGTSATCNSNATVNASGVATGPWATYNHAMQSTPLIKQGDTVYFLDGTYNQSMTLMVGGLSHVQPTTVACMHEQTCLITYMGSANAILPSASHTLVGGVGHGFIIDAPNATKNQPILVYTAIFDLTITDNYIHDTPSGGIAITHADWIDIYNNIVCCSGQKLVVQASGIAIGYNSLQTYSPTADLVNFPYGGTYHNVVSYNFSYGNVDCMQADTWSATVTYDPTQTVYESAGKNYQWSAQYQNINSEPANANSNWVRGAVACPTSTTDGEAIIIDTNGSVDVTNSGTAGATVVEYNVGTGNGGRGIECFISDNTTIRFNTVSGNNQDTYGNDTVPSEIEMDRCENSVATMNIAIVTQSNTINSQYVSGISMKVCTTCMVYSNVVLTVPAGVVCTVTYGAAASQCANNLQADPLLPNPTISTSQPFSQSQTIANFTPPANSPARNFNGGTAGAVQ